jgi:hypothetical protein
MEGRGGGESQGVADPKNLQTQVFVVPRNRDKIDTAIKGQAIAKAVEIMVSAIKLIRFI